MNEADVIGSIEKETGTVIIVAFKELIPMYFPGVIVKNHGPFTWGKNANDAVHNSVVLEELAKMAFIAKTIQPNASMNSLLTDKHFSRKHGKDSYYGQ